MSYNSNYQQGQGYPPQQNQGYPPQQGQGYPPQQNQGYPPQQGQGYPPQQNQGYPPQQGQGYPPQQGHGYPPQQGQGYPPQQGQGYPPQQGQGYPPQQGQGYPPQQGHGYPPQKNQSYSSQQNQGYPPQQNQGYHQQQGQGNSSQQNQGYPHQQSQGYPAQQNQSSGYPASSQSNTTQTSSIPPGDPKKLGRPHPNLRWVKTTGKTMPQDAVQGGFESDGKPLFIARAFYKGSCVVGKAAPHIGCLIPYDTKERQVDEYYVLCGSAKELRWRECSGRLKVEGWAPLEAGNEADGTELFVAKAKFKGGEPVGKVGTHMAGGICFGYDCKEVFLKPQEVYYVLSHP